LSHPYCLSILFFLFFHILLPLLTFRRNDDQADGCCWPPLHRNSMLPSLLFFMPTVYSSFSLFVRRSNDTNMHIFPVLSSLRTLLWTP
jgi:hypothetical protein